jgi:hypothetical protein
MGNALRIAAANDEHVEPTHQWARVLLSAVVRNAFGDHQVQVREVCAKAAVIQAAVTPAAGSRVLLMRGAITVLGTVAWTRGNKYCLEFQDEIDHEQMLIPIEKAKDLRQPLKALFPLPEEVPGTVSKH